MSVEVTVTIALALITGLCVLLWNTDGSLDWLPASLGVISSSIGIGAIIWNTALEHATFELAPLRSASREVISTGIKSREVSTWVTVGLLLCGLLLTCMPRLFDAARQAKK